MESMRESISSNILRETLKPIKNKLQSFITKSNHAKNVTNKENKDNNNNGVKSIPNSNKDSTSKKS